MCNMTNRIRINNTDLSVSRINLGTNVYDWTSNEENAFKILDVCQYRL